MPKNLIYQRSVVRDSAEEYHSVEIPITDTPYVYQFRIWDLPRKGRCVLVKEDSSVLRYIKVGDIVDVGYHKAYSRMPAEFSRTKIRHITKDKRGRFKGHYLVGI
jgi:hypothetical protein